MELLQLKYFMVTAQEQHMTRAAELLHIAQPALSQAIKRLETELGVRLFIRSGRGIRLSEEGFFLKEKLKPILSALDDIPRQVSHTAEVNERTIKINILSASELIADIIMDYKELHPELNFQLSQQADEKNWDIRIATVIPSQNTESTHIVLREEIFIAVPKDSPYAGEDSIDLKTVRDASFISLDKGKPFSVLTQGYCLKAGFSPDVVFESDSPATVRNLIGAGLGVAFWPAYSWGKQPSNKVKLLHITQPNCIREIYVAQKKEKSSSPLKNGFYHYMAAYLNDLQ